MLGIPSLSHETLKWQSWALRFVIHRKPNPKNDDDVFDQRLSEALKRLAVTSPHLLHDIGFRDASGAANPNVRVWVRNDLRIVMRETGQAIVDVSKDHRGDDCRAAPFS